MRLLTKAALPVELRIEILACRRGVRSIGSGTVAARTENLIKRRLKALAHC